MEGSLFGIGIGEVYSSGGEDSGAIGVMPLLMGGVVLKIPLSLRAELTVELAVSEFNGIGLDTLTGNSVPTILIIRREKEINACACGKLVGRFAGVIRAEIFKPETLAGYKVVAPASVVVGVVFELVAQSAVADHFVDLSPFAVLLLEAIHVDRGAHLVGDTECRYFVIGESLCDRQSSFIIF